MRYMKYLRRADDFSLRHYAEDIEKQLKMLGIRVDLLFPNDSVPINKVLGNIQSRGCLYAILVLPPNMDQSSLTLTVNLSIELLNFRLIETFRFCTAMQRNIETCRSTMQFDSSTRISSTRPSGFHRTSTPIQMRSKLSSKISLTTAR